MRYVIISLGLAGILASSGCQNQNSPEESLATPTPAQTTVDQDGSFKDRIGESKPSPDPTATGTMPGNTGAPIAPVATGTPNTSDYR